MEKSKEKAENQDIFKRLKNLVDSSEDKIGTINEIKAYLHELSVIDHPVDTVLWVKKEKVVANNWNPNSHHSKEFELLYKSIQKSGLTQPIVTIYDPDADQYVVVDGFHRTATIKAHEDLHSTTDGRIPVVVMDGEINDIKAATVRHNRARGKHSTDGMGSLVFQMLDDGWDEAAICNELGMEAEEIVRLKHITGFSKLFEDASYRKAWMSKKQIQHKLAWEKKHGKKAPSN